MKWRRINKSDYSKKNQNNRKKNKMWKRNNENNDFYHFSIPRLISETWDFRCDKFAKNTKTACHQVIEL